MLRITDLDGNGRDGSLKVEGRIVGVQAEELAAAVDRASELSPRVRLDMSGVSYVDRMGLELLLRMRARGVELLNCSPFIQTLMAGESR